MAGTRSGADTAQSSLKLTAAVPAGLRLSRNNSASRSACAPCRYLSCLRHDMFSADANSAGLIVTALKAYTTDTEGGRGPGHGSCTVRARPRQGLRDCRR